MMYVCAYMLCTQSVSKCGHSQGHKHICEFAQNGFIYKSICDMIWHIYTCEHMHVYKQVQSLSIRKGTNIVWESHSTWVHIYQRIRDMMLDIYIIIYTCEYIYVHKKGFWAVSNRKGTDICEFALFAQHEVIHKSICNMKFVNLWIYLCIQRSSNCEHSQGHRHMWVRTTRSHTQKYL